jgi:propionate CoA-transferase
LVDDGVLRVTREGVAPKFVERVQQVTFSGERARARGQVVHYITERCVLRLTELGLELIEIAPGLDLERDVLAAMAFRPTLAPELRRMDSAIFRSQRMGLDERPPLVLKERVDYDTSENVLFVNFEGMHIDTIDDAEELAAFLDPLMAGIGHRFNVVVNYDNFRLGHAAQERFWEMVAFHERDFYLSSTRYSTDAFFRRRLGEDFARASLGQQIYRDFEEARRALELAQTPVAGGEQLVQAGEEPAGAT